MEIPPVQMKQYAEEIDLNVLKETFSNLQLANSFAMDIGGSLIKIVYQKMTKINHKVPVCLEVSYDYKECEVDHSSLCFIKFETRHLTNCLTFILENIVADSLICRRKEEKPHLKVTGGGAVKYKDLLTSKLNLIIDKEDEMETLISGCLFLLKNIPDEVFYFQKLSENSIPHFTSICLMNPFPFLLVNIGSGISIVRVDSESNFTRVGGTSIGGGTFWGIGTIISGGKSFAELLMMASRGDSTKVDMLVKDIYGGPSEILGLSEDLIASSFGLAAKEGEMFTKDDVLNSLLLTISNNIGQLSCLHANICNLDRIIFGGFFTRGHIETMKTISSSVDFWSSGKFRALFLRHEGYLGAVGAFLKSAEPTTSIETYHPNDNQNILDSNWNEDYAGSVSFSNFNDLNSQLEVKDVRNEQSCSCYNNGKKIKETAYISKSLENLSASSKTLIGFETRELERMCDKLEVFTLLNSPQSYVPDSWDLTSDIDARTYWLKCFKENIPRETAYQSQREHSETAKSRSVKYLENYVKYLSNLEENPALHGILTVRCLLDAHQNFLRKYGFTDPFWLQKKKENEFAIKMFTTRISYLQSLDWESRQYEVIIGLLAGNVFDWGSKEVISLMKKSKDGVIDFSDAINKLQPRPWLIDCYENWFEKVNSKSSCEPVYHSVVIFCDNSGFDFIIGVIPFALELLSRGSTVILTANSQPAINDVTFSEIVILIKNLCTLSPEIDDALRNDKLILVPNGQMSPCLDLRFVSRRLNQIIESTKVDLVVIEGMARAIHTNLMAEFFCDSIKVAVIKNAWLAKRLGGELFSVVFKYEQFSRLFTSN